MKRQRMVFTKVTRFIWMCDIVHTVYADMQSVSFLNNLRKQRVFIRTSIVIASKNIVQFAVLKQRHGQIQIWHANEKNLSQTFTWENYHEMLSWCSYFFCTWIPADSKHLCAHRVCLKLCSWGRIQNAVQYTQINSYNMCIPHMMLQWHRCVQMVRPNIAIWWSTIKCKSNSHVRTRIASHVNYMLHVVRKYQYLQEPNQTYA